MALYLKKGMANSNQIIAQDQVCHVVKEIIMDVEKNGDAAVRKYSEKYDHWSPDVFQLSLEDVQGITSLISNEVVDDIKFSQQQVRFFAEEQRRSILDIEVETIPGVTLGHRNIPIQSVGCYIPGGSHPLVSSAAMNIIPAKIAGVKRIIACTPPYQGKPPSATIAAMSLAGADEIFILGGVQALAAMAIGTESIQPVDMIVGPGNAYIAEAKRQLYGRVGIDLIAGPSEVLIIADESADAKLVAADLLGQAEHGSDSPCVLITTCESLALDIENEIEHQLKSLPTKEIAAMAWKNYGEIILVENDEEAVNTANNLAFEHVQVITSDPDLYLSKLTNYGSLFLGPETCVPYGDFAIGTNHTLPTQGAARYTGGLWVGKFLKTVTYQKCSRSASIKIGEYCSRLAELEGFFGHKAQADLRLRRYQEATGSP